MTLAALVCGTPRAPGSKMLRSIRRVSREETLLARGMRAADSLC